MPLWPWQSEKWVFEALWPQEYTDVTAETRLKRERSKRCQGKTFSGTRWIRMASGGL